MTQAESEPQLHLLAQLEGHSDRAWHLAWNPRMPVLASCSTDKDVRLHAYSFIPSSASDFSLGKASTSKSPAFNLREVIPTGHKRTVRQVAWNPSGRTLATASFDSTVGIWERIEDIEGASPPSDGSAIKLSHGGQAVGEPEWDCIGTLEGHESECKSVAFSHTGGVLASCSRDKSVWIWEVQPDAEFECLSVLMEHSQDVKVVAWHPKEEILASASYDDAIKLYIDDPSDDWFCYSSLTGHTSTVWSLSFSPCGKFLASASDDKTVRLWRRLSADECEAHGVTPEGKMPGRAGEKWICVNTMKGWHDRTIYSVSWGVDRSSKREGNLGRIATGDGNGRICVFEVTEDPESSKLQLVTKLVGKMDSSHGTSDVNCVCWAPERLKSKADDGEAKIEEVKDEGHPVTDADRVGHALMSDMLASAGDDGSIKVWTVAGSVLARSE